ncbi:hypothetical protein I3842_05G151900 [Carya illinoinensis]|uniref:Uncharacterized protein n=1 Tax=Carya illinoinensis TaxID=32201 RepID=A0A922F3D6_CARIL|nr:hypothetical protein I3842_05G151900 [Carya illinoinensis]
MARPRLAQGVVARCVDTNASSKPLGRGLPYNVAKCDTWCELQNPANHRVFERKLRPKPFSRRHVCYGVTLRCPHPKPRMMCAPKRESWATSATTIGG